MGIPANPIRPGRGVSGRISWFGGPHDSMAGGTTASGRSTSVPGIALYNRATLGGYFLVTAPNGRKAILQQTDLGPAPFTGRAIDFTYSSLGKFGYSEGNFPTNARASAVYLGKTIPKNYQGLARGAQGQTVRKTTGGLSVTPVSYKAVTQHGFDSVNYNADVGRTIAGNYIASATDPFSAGAPKTGITKSTINAPLFQSGALSTQMPNRSDYMTAQTHLERIAGTPVSLHPKGQVALADKAVNDARAAGAPRAAQKLLRMVHFVLGAQYSQGNHDAINQNEFSVKARGTDCSGLISWLMGPQGLGIWHSSLATPDIPNAPGLQGGRGRVITIWNNRQAGNAGHVFIRIGNQFFASEGGVGVRQLPMSEVQNYLSHGSDGGTYQAFHPRGL